MSKAETSFAYENKVWECALLPYRIIVCKDGIQYIVQLREQIKCRNMSYHMDWSGIAERYPQLALAGLPEHSPGMLEDEVRGRVMSLNQNLLAERLVSLGCLCLADTLNPQLSKSEGASAPSPGYTMQG
jgi:hypothetical protein